CSGTALPRSATSSKAMCGSASRSVGRSDMRVPLSWLRDHVTLPETSPRALAQRLTMAGLKVEHVDETGSDINGVVVARVDNIEVTPDRGYTMSVRGVARELAIAYDVAYDDPGRSDVPAYGAPGYDVVIDDADGCDRYVARLIENVDPTAPSPQWLQRRLTLA